MKIIYSQKHLLHTPPAEIFNGNMDPHAEVPDRIENIRKALTKELHLDILAPNKFSISWIKKLHDDKYIKFLEKTSKLTEEYLYPSVFPYDNYLQIDNDLAKRGLYAFDMYTPINCQTFKTACESVNIALTAATVVAEGEKSSYALCRPPGHHAEKAKMGGYCYFNNAAIAAEYLSKHGKVAILDVDVHHGNGTQSLFYDRSDVLFISIHADPKYKFPYFSGTAKEKGVGRGLGFNINYPLKLKTGDLAYHQVLLKSIDQIKIFQPKYLIISLGYDTHKDDPIGGLSLTTSYYFQMAKAIRLLNLSTVFIQEGGYNTKILGYAAVSFVSAFI